jgi:hypothetical protein
MYVQLKNKVRPCNHCSSRKAMSIKTTLACICSLRYPACNAHAPCCHLWLDPLYIIFPHYLTKGMNFEKVTEHKVCVLIFSTTFVPNLSHSNMK